jgi:cytochrome c oxidase cbb3-type subunit III
MHRVLAASVFAAFTVVATHPTAQGTPQTTPPAGGTAQPPAPQPDTPPAGRGQGRGGRGGGRGPAVFPAQQRPPGDPALIERGKGIYSITCSGCHGADLRGGGTGGPNLLRSPVVLMDQAGELIAPIIHGERKERGMPALPLKDDEIKAVAEFIHSILSLARGQGAPPESDTPPPNPIVGDAAAGQTYFAAKCSSCHSPTGDLKGIATAHPDGKMLQTLWVSGGAGVGRGGGRGRGSAAATLDPAAVTATVTLPSGEKVEGPIVRIDNFLITLRTTDGSLRSIRRDGDRPKVDIKDPLQPHKAMLPTLTDKDMRDVTAYLATFK